MAEFDGATVELDTDADNVKLNDFQYGLAQEVLEQLDELGQSGLEVMTSGGKSYIAAYIMQEYVNKHREGKILWLAPKSTIKNVKKKIFSKLAIKGKVKYVGYEELARRDITEEQSICEEFKIDDSIKLIVFDECHKTFATKTFEGIKKIMVELGSADRLAMSATPKRYGGINTFSILVPNVTEPVTFSLSDAIEHGLLPTVNYILANVNISKNDFNTLTKYRELVKNDVRAQELYNEVEQAFKNFEFKLERDLAQLLTDHVNSDGSDGERHIAFFSSIEQLRNMKEGVRTAFEKSYPNCIINVVEYHSGVSDEENNKTLQQFVIDDPEPNRVDVMLSVDKATESIHPDNVRSVMMFRGTQSIRVYLQQMGRGIMLKAYHPEDIVIFDFASNVDCMDGSQSIYIGKSELNDRVSSNLNYSNTIEDIKRIIMGQFGFKNGIEPKVGLDKLSDCLEKIKRMHSKLELNALRDDLNLVLNAYKLVGEKQYRKTKNIYYMINSLKSEINTMSSDKPKHRWENNDIEDNPADELKKTRLYAKYKSGLSNQLTLITEMLRAYQMQFLSDGIKINRDVYRLFTAMKHKAYLIADNGPDSEEILKDIDYIKKEIDEHGRIEDSTNNHAKYKLRKLRLASTKNEMTSNICCYARRNKVDIEMKTLKISDIDDLCDTQADKEVVSAFKPIMRNLAQLDEDIKNEKEIQFEDWLDITARLLVVRRKYSGFEIKDICTTYIYKKFKEVITAFKLTQEESENGAKLLSALCKIEDGEYPNKMEEDYIFEHSKASNMSEYELKILKYCNKKVSKYTQEIEDKTEFMSLYNRAHSGDVEAIKNMLGYNRELLDTKRKKLLNTTAFRQVKEEVKDTVGPEVLIQKAKLMFEANGDYKKLRKEISDAIVDGTLDDMSVAYTPFRDTEIDMAKEILKLSDTEFEEAISQIAIVGTTLNKLVSRCSQYNCCTKDLIHNVLKITALRPSTKQRLTDIYNLI